MAADTVLLTRKRCFSAALETTTGTAVTVGATEGVYNIFEHKLDAEIQPVERMGQGSLTNLPPVPGARMGKYTFKTELYNAASAPTWLSVLLVACGCTVSSSTYTPSSSVYNTATMALYQDGRKKVLAGCAGNVKFNGSNTGQPVMAEWEFSGKWVVPSAVSLIAPTFPTAIPPRNAAATLTIGAATYVVSKWQFDLGNTVTMRQDANDSGASGFRAAIVTARKPVLTISLESPPLGTHDFYGDHLAMTGAAFSCAIGSGSNGILTLAAGNLQLLSPPQDEDDGGRMMDSLTYIATSTSADGEWSLVRS